MMTLTGENPKLSTITESFDLGNELFEVFTKYTGFLDHSRKCSTMQNSTVDFLELNKVN